MPGVLASRCCPCMTDGKGSRNDVPFGADSHGFCDHCLRFTTTITRGHARLASSCLPGFAGRDWLPAGSQRKVSVRTSSFPKLRLARPPTDSVSTEVLRALWASGQKAGKPRPRKQGSRELLTGKRLLRQELRAKCLQTPGLFTVQVSAAERDSVICLQTLSCLRSQGRKNGPGCGDPGAVLCEEFRLPFRQPRCN